MATPNSEFVDENTHYRQNRYLVKIGHWHTKLGVCHLVCNRKQRPNPMRRPGFQRFIPQEMAINEKKIFLLANPSPHHLVTAVLHHPRHPGLEGGAPPAVVGPPAGHRGDVRPRLLHRRAGHGHHRPRAGVGQGISRDWN